jgi:hypothetical protein
MAIGPVLALDDAVGLKMRALHDRAAQRDFIDVHAVPRPAADKPTSTWNALP